MTSLSVSMRARSGDGGVAGRAARGCGRGAFVPETITASNESDATVTATIARTAFIPCPPVCRGRAGKYPPNMDFRQAVYDRAATPEAHRRGASWYYAPAQRHRWFGRTLDDRDFTPETRAS